MTIRSGGRPRDARAPHAHPYDPEAYATEAIPPYSEPVTRGGRGDRNGSRGGGGGIGGIVKFLIFALVLGGIVLAVALTALRPLVNSAILGWAADNPAAFSMPIVKDIVAEDIGTAMTRAASTRSGPGRVRRPERRHRLDDRSSPRDRGTHPRRPGVHVHRDQPRPDRRTAAGHVPPAQEHDPRPGRDGPPRAAKGPVRRDPAADRPPPRAGDGQARDAAARHGPQGLLRPRQEAAEGAPRRLPVAQEGACRRPARGRSRRVPVALDLQGPARHDARGARPADARQLREERRRGPDGCPEEPRALVLPGADAGLDGRARGEARRRAAADRRRLPEPSRSRSSSRRSSCSPTRRSSTSTTR